MSRNEDAKLVEQCLRGDAVAFEKLVDKYQGPIFNVAYRMTNSYEDAEDIAQTVFVKAFTKLKAYNPDYKFFSWIYRMAINESINHLKKRKRLVKLTRTIPSREGNPEEDYRNLELSDAIQDAMMEIAVDYRVLIVLRHFLGCSYDEMAKMLEISEAKVKSRLYSARQKLKDAMVRNGMPAYGR
jgi:RNA polymerase sigma-70 factor (ECF subfamily)